MSDNQRILIDIGVRHVMRLHTPVMYKNCLFHTSWRKNCRSAVSWFYFWLLIWYTG